MTRGYRWALGLAFTSVLAGCGTYVPPLQEYYEHPGAGGDLAQAILVNVTCEARNALFDVIAQDVEDVRRKRKPARDTAWLEAWGVQIALSITVEEKSGLQPTVTGLPPSPVSAIVSLAAGANVSADASRIDKLNAYHAVRELARSRCDADSRPGGPFLMQSDLKLKEWLVVNIVAGGTGYVTYPSDSSGPLKQDVISHQVKFVVETGGNFTPGWKLTRVLVDQAGDLLTASRTRTHDLTITLGPLDKTELKAGRIVPSRVAANAALASDIGISVANNLRSLGVRQVAP